jgi:hypothetical protein
MRALKYVYIHVCTCSYIYIYTYVYIGVGGQYTLVDELYKEAIDNNIVNPLFHFKKGDFTHVFASV